MIQTVIFFILLYASAFAQATLPSAQVCPDAQSDSASATEQSIQKIAPPHVVGVPPADAGRGLVRVNDLEIRHYAGKGAPQFLKSLDNGETWNQVDLPANYPDATCLEKESPSIVRSPVTGEFLRAEPLYRSSNADDGLYQTSGGLDGIWEKILDSKSTPIKLGGILRTPIWVNDNQRILVPGHGGGCWTWYSDDQGKSWSQSNKINAPAHKPGGVHKGTRWNHGMVEATIVELKNKNLWMIARTAQDQHYESFSSDFGTTWSQAKPSRFWGTITMPTFFRMSDGRLLFLWSNTTALPEVAREKKRGGEDVFTNRDAIHAAISEDDGKTWIGFRELILDEHRNNPDYAVTKGSNDRGKHQSEVVQLDKHRVLFSCGQHPIHRRLMIMDVRWLYEKQRSCLIVKEGSQNWSTHQYINKIVGHCGYNRVAGATPDEQGALNLFRVDDERLTNPNQGATWNFPAGQSGELETTIGLNKGGAGIQICLTDRWFNPTDSTVDRFANCVLKIDSTGKAPDGTQLLTPGIKHRLALRWDIRTGRCLVSVDGKQRPQPLLIGHDCANGISYVHYYNPASTSDEIGVSIYETKATVDPISPR